MMESQEKYIPRKNVLSETVSKMMSLAPDSPLDCTSDVTVEYPFGLRDFFDEFLPVPVQPPITFAMLSPKQRELLNALGNPAD